MNNLRLPWHRETVGHKNVKKIAAKVAAELAVPLAEGIPANTDATWIINADGQVVAFVGNGPRQTDNADAIIAAVSRAEPTPDDRDREEFAQAAEPIVRWYMEHVADPEVVAKWAGLRASGGD